MDGALCGLSPRRTKKRRLEMEKKAIWAIVVLLSAIVLSLSVLNACGNSNDDGDGNSSSDCKEYCAEIYKPGVPVDTVMCAGKVLVDYGFDVFGQCDPPENPAECDDCVLEVGASSSACREAIESCLDDDEVETYDDDCIEYCAKLYKPGVPDDKVMCAGQVLVNEGYDVFDQCDPPENPAECDACVQKVGATVRVCRKAIDKCL